MLFSHLKNYKFNSKNTATSVILHFYIGQVKKNNIFEKAIPKKNLKQKDRLRFAEAIINYEFTGDVKHM